MKRILILLLFLPICVFPQYVAIQKSEKVEIRTINGAFVTSAFYSGLKSVSQADTFIVLWFASDKIEIRNYELKYIKSSYFSDLKQISTNKDWIIFYFKNGKVEIRDKELHYHYSWFS